MSNDQIYAGGLLNRALNPATQPPEIQIFLAEEFALIDRFIPDRSRVIDFGCGSGRHLYYLARRLGTSMGVDYESGYIATANRRDNPPNLHFVVGDAAAVPANTLFDFAICLTNTWGTMENKAVVLHEMRRLSPTPGTRLLSVYSPASIGPRRAWYDNLDHAVLDETAEYLLTEGGFKSEHFTADRLRQIVGNCTIEPLTDIAWAVVF